MNADAGATTGVRHDACCGHCAPAALAAPRPPAVGARGALAAAAAVLLAAGCLLDVAGRAPGWIQPLFLAAILAGSTFPARRAWAALGRGVLDINVLMIIAVAGAVAIGEWEEGAMVVFLFAVAQWLEAQSVARARAAIRSLLDLAPPQARLADGSDQLVPVEAVAPGALLAVRPGERVPLDGVVTGGCSAVNQAPITGESMPVEKAEGDEVYAGTINGHGLLTMVVTRNRDDTTLARIVHLVEEAQSARAPLQQFIDRFAAWYTPAVVVLAALVGLVPILAGADVATWIYRGLVVLVVACPCALVISTPVSMVSALAGAARQGVLVKGGAALERLAAVATVAVDKTGTLTRGEVAVGAIEPLPGVDEARLLAVAAAVEQHSEHPIARAIVREARGRGLPLLEATGVQALPGLGVCGTVAGEPVWCAAPRHARDRVADAALLLDRADAVTRAGHTPVVVVADDTPLGVIGVVDGERAAAAAALADLRRLGVTRVAMLTGDARPVAEAMAARVGVDEVRAELLPADKVAAIADLKRHGAVAMVGDGINDAPALAAADVGIVMGAIGSDAAIETADLALMTDDLSRLPYALRLARATVQNVRTNVAIALGLKAAFIAAAAAGVATLWMAVLADTGASVIVLANALRLRRFG